MSNDWRIGSQPHRQGVRKGRMGARAQGVIHFLSTVGVGLWLSIPRTAGAQAAQREGVL
jgi:hypothetical protein